MRVLEGLLLLILLETAAGWGGDELEVFDVVEEVNQNFYTLMGVERDADGGAIKKAFRKLSLVLHPDKSDAPDAEIKFRQLVAVYDILKDPNKRKCYNDVLDNGLPNWKSAVYYYRRVRKMGLKEMFVILFVLVSIAQYLYGWANYFEKKLTVEEFLNSKNKKEKKKQKKAKSDTGPAYSLEEFEDVLVKPSVKDTLPCQIPRWLWFLFFSGPPLLYHTICEYFEERKLRKQLELEEQEEQEEEIEVVPRAPRKRKTFVLPELKDDPNADQSETTKNYSKPIAPPVISGGLWTDDDLLDLAKLLKKYPVGTTERWEKIGESMNRPPSEVAHMAHKLNDNILKSLQQKSDKEEDENEEDKAQYLIEEPRKVKTKGGKVGEVAESNLGSWSQVQQKALEAALLKFPKGAANDRWVKIAKCVPGKTKEECMLRYKYLVDMVKKKKDETETVCDNSTQELHEDHSKQNGVNTEILLENSESLT